ncbi:MAG: flavin reductase [Acidimicrobiales bacterium]|nr:MAG: flavin reductase [Acidimicrobiales bacterium]
MRTPEEVEEYDRLRRRVLWAMPYGLYVLGSRSGDELNAMTLNWATQVSFDPKLIAVSVEKTAFTHRLVSDGRAFSLNLIARDDRPVVRKFTKPVSVDHQSRTMNGYEYWLGVSGAPILSIAVAYLDCRVHQQVDVGSHTLFIGEVVDAAFQREEDTPVLRMEDTRMNYGG